MGESFTYRLRMQNKLHLHFKPVFEYKGNFFDRLKNLSGHNFLISSHETIQFFFLFIWNLGQLGVEIFVCLR